MSRKDMEKKQAASRVPEEKKATPLAIGLFVLGLVGIAFVAFILVWSLTDGSKPQLGASASQSVSQSEASALALL